MLKQCIFKKVNFTKSSERFRFSRIIVPYLFKLQRLKCNITYFPRTWCHKTFHFTVLFQTATFEIQRLKCNGACFPRIIFPYFFKPQRLKYNVWNATLLVFSVLFSRTFSKISRYKSLQIFIKFYRQCSLQISLYIQQWEFLYDFIHLTLMLLSRNTTVRTRTW